VKDFERSLSSSPSEKFACRRRMLDSNGIVNQINGFKSFDWSRNAIPHPTGHNDIDPANNRQPKNVTTWYELLQVPYDKYGHDGWNEVNEIKDEQWANLMGNLTELFH